jgi:hypothetical protein
MSRRSLRALLHKAQLKAGLTIECDGKSVLKYPACHVA